MPAFVLPTLAVVGIVVCWAVIILFIYVLGWPW